MPRNEGALCPICLDAEADHNHHIIPREAVLNGVRGIDGPTIDLCASCHGKLHGQAVNLLSKNPNKVDYFDAEQAARAHKLLAVLTAAIESSREARDPGQRMAVVVHFHRWELDLIRSVKQDLGYTRGKGNVSDLIHDMTMSFVSNHM